MHAEPRQKDDHEQQDLLADRDRIDLTESGKERIQRQPCRRSLVRSLAEAPVGRRNSRMRRLEQVDGEDEAGAKQRPRDRQCEDQVGDSIRRRLDPHASRCRRSLDRSDRRPGRVSLCCQRGLSA